MRISIQTALKDPEARREMEKESLSQMISVYCRGNHHTKKGQLCPRCRELQTYALHRTDKCPFMKTKTFCSACKVHCYTGDKREKIKAVMKYSGPRMLFHHPILAIAHMVVTLKQKRASAI